MLVIRRRTPKLNKGFKIILDNGTEEILTWNRFTGFRIVDVDAVQKEAEKRKGDDELVDGPMEKLKLE